MTEFFEDRHFVGAMLGDGEAVLFDRRSHATHALDAQSAAIYRAAVAAKFNEESVLRDMRAAGFDGADGLTLARVEQILAELRDAGLLDAG